MRRIWTALCIFLLAGTAAFAAEADLEAALSGLDSPDASTRAAARETLSSAKEAALPFLERGLESDRPLTSTACADLVGELGLRGGREALTRLVAASDTPVLVVRAACRALGRVGDSRDIDLLAGRAGAIPEAAVALGRLAYPAALPPLKKILEGGDASPEVAWAVAALGDPAGVDALIADLGGSREDSLAALRWLREYAGEDAGSDAAAWTVWWRREKLARWLGNPDWDLSEQAIAEVRKRKAEGGQVLEDTIADLLAIAEDTTAERFSRTKAIMALGIVGRKDLAAPIVNLLNRDLDPQVRLYAAGALGRIGDPATTVDIALYLTDDEEPFRKLSAKEEGTRYYTIDSELCKSLVKMGVKGGLDFMIRQMHQNRRIRVYHEAVRLLRQVSGKQFGFRPDAPSTDRYAAADRWRDWFDSNRSELVIPDMGAVRTPAFKARVAGMIDRLGNYKFLYMLRAREPLVLLGEAAMPELIAGLSRTEKHIRIHCAEILGRIHAHRARGALAALLTDEKEEVRAAAASALAEMGPGDAVNYVIDALRDPSDNVRIAAARALAKADFTKAVPALKAALDRKGDIPQAFRREAYYALGAHGEVQAVDRLSEMLETTDIAFRQVVADRLRELTGVDPGVVPATMDAWRRAWEVSRKSYKGLRSAESSR